MINVRLLLVYKNRLCTPLFITVYTVYTDNSVSRQEVTMNTKKPKSKQATPPPAIMEPVNSESLVSNESEPVIEAADSGANDSIKKGKHHKTKVVRDSFSFPEDDYRKISELKKTCLTAGVHVKKSEVLRAGLHALTQLGIDELIQAVEKVEKVQTGRPSASVD